MSRSANSQPRHAPGQARGLAHASSMSVDPFHYAYAEGSTSAPPPFASERQRREPSHADSALHSTMPGSSGGNTAPRPARIPPPQHDSYWQGTADEPLSPPLSPPVPVLRYNQNQAQTPQYAQAHYREAHRALAQDSYTEPYQPRRNALGRKRSANHFRPQQPQWQQSPFADTHALQLAPERPHESYTHRQGAEPHAGTYSSAFAPAPPPASPPMAHPFAAAQNPFDDVPRSPPSPHSSPTVVSASPYLAYSADRDGGPDEKGKAASSASASDLTDSTPHKSKEASDSSADAAEKKDKAASPAPPPPRRPKKAGVTALFRTLPRRDVALKLAPAVLLSAVRGGAPPLMTRVLGGIFTALSDFARASPPDAFLRGAAWSAARHTLLAAIFRAALELTALGVAVLVVGSLALALWVAVGEQVARDLRSDLYAAVAAKPMLWFDAGMGSGKAQTDAAGADGDSSSSAGAAGLMARFARNTDDVRIAVTQQLGLLVTAGTTALACLGLAFATSWALMLVILASIPMTMVMTVVTMRIGYPLILAEYAAVEKASGQVERTVRAIATVKAFNAQSQELERFRRLMAASGHGYMRSCVCWAARLGLTSTLSLSMFVQGFWFGAFLVHRGTLSAGEVMTVFWAALVASTNLQNIMNAWTSLDKGLAAYSSLQEILQPEQPQQQDASLGAVSLAIEHIPASPQHVRSFSAANAPAASRPVVAMRKVRPARACRGELVLRHVHFQYPSRPDVPILRDVSMFFPAGETTYILGGSGSGKSTIAQLLLRLYRPSSGEIELDANDFAYLAPEWCREHIAAVTQQPIIFDMSARDNVAIGAPRWQGSKIDLAAVPDGEIRTACRIALLHDFLRDLPEGFDTRLGSGGANLSGGQKQRLAIARAVLRDPTVLILDEAVSALDITARLLVHEALKSWRKGRTTIIITHDISQVGADDFVYVMSGGNVEQQGYRRNLEDVPGAFQEMAGAMGGMASAKNEPSPTGLDQAARKSLQLLTPPTQDGGLFQQLKRLSRAIDPVPPLPPAGSHALDPRVANRRSGAPGGVLDRAGAMASSRRPKAVQRRPAALIIDQSHQVAISEEVQAAPTSAPARPADKVTTTVGFALKSVPNKLLLSLGIFIATFSGMINPAFSVVLGKLMATMGTTVNSAQVLAYSLTVLGLALADGLAIFLRYLVLEKAADGWVQKMRRRAYGNVLRQHKSWFDSPDNSAQHLCQSITKDGEDARKLIGQVLGNLWSSFILLFGGLACALAFGWQITLVGIGFAGVLFAGISVQTTMLNKREATNKAHREEVAKIFYSLAANMRGIRAMAIEPIFQQQFDEAVAAAYSSGLRAAPLQGIGAGLGEGLTYLAEAAIYILSAYLLAAGTYDLTRITVTLNLILFGCTFASQGLVFLPGLSKAVQAISDMRRLLSLPDDSAEKRGESRPPIIGALSFQAVRFAYPTRTADEVLRGATFTVQPGESVAIVGGSGCGKSTVTALLQRLYEPSDGCVLLDGRPLASLDCQYLREHVAVVSQHPDLFDATVADNISYGANRSSAGARTATLAEVEAAARVAHVDEFVQRLPKGYATDLGNNASLVSGGQAQRLAIARALVRRQARVLILDECTSALDPENQAAVTRSLLASRERGGARRPGVTTVVVTHKKEVMQMCDRIIVLQNGVVAQQDTYSELLQEKGGAFAALASAGEWGA